MLSWLIWVLLPLLLFIEPQPLGFLGEEVVLSVLVCVCVCVWTPPHPLVFLLREGKHVSSHYRRCVWGEQGAVCLCSALQSFESHPSRLPARSPAQSGSVCRDWEALARVIALWGIAPALFACLFTFRLVCHLVSSVFLCHLAAVAWQAWRCLSF